MYIQIWCNPTPSLKLKNSLASLLQCTRVEKLITCSIFTFTTVWLKFSGGGSCGSSGGDAKDWFLVTNNNDGIQVSFCPYWRLVAVDIPLF